MSYSKHICLVTPGFPANAQDDTCVPYVQDFLRLFTALKPDVRFTVVALQYPYTTKSYAWNNVSVYPCGGENKRFVGKVKTWLKAKRILDRIHESQPIDVVHSLWLTEATLSAQQWAQKKKVFHVATAMGQDVLKSNNYLKLVNLAKLRLVVVSKAQQSALERNLGVVKSEIIPWVVEEVKPSNSDKIVDVLGVGSLINVKQFELFIEVLEHIGRTKKSIEARIIGDGADRGKLEALASNLPTNITLEFLGHLRRNQVFDYMNKSKVLLHCSKFESQGFVFNEALASGMAIVSTPVGISQQMDRWSIADNPEDLAKSVLSQIDKRYDSVHLFSAEKMVNAYDKMYRSM